ncbi:MAG: hypothetical protein DMG81_05500 [Acidobacteria bacterium]|nr:MAG: hypothetical protein DMG81_05500 [Acidobacteriota bacterium]
MKTLRTAVLLTTVAVPLLCLSAFAQQEVDPTYYDPWAAAPAIKVVAHANAKPTAGKLRKVSSTAETRPKSKKQTRTVAASHSEATQAMASARTPR